MTTKGTGQKSKQVEKVESMNVYQRFHACQAEAQVLHKDTKVEYGKTRYRAVSDYVVKTAVRPLLEKYGLTLNVEADGFAYEHDLVPTCNIRADGSKTESVGHSFVLRFNIRITNIDNPSEFILIPTFGQGIDSQDKASGKAYTYAMKTACIHMFLMPSSEDTDNTSSEELEANGINNKGYQKRSKQDNAFPNENFVRRNIVNMAYEKFGRDAVDGHGLVTITGKELKEIHKAVEKGELPDVLKVKSE